jgi:hypothetical protein
MNPDRDLDRLLEAWFAEGPREVADRVVLQVADRIERQSQRPAWRLPRRDSQVNLNLRWIAAAAVLVVAIFAGTRVLAPTPNSGTAGISPTASSSKSPSPSPAATYTVTAGPQGTTVLHAPNFDVPLSLTLGADWKITAIDKGVVDLGFCPAHARACIDMGIHSMALVTLPGATLTDPWIPVPADFVAWIDQRPEFVPSAPRTVTIAGRSGTLIDTEYVWKDGTAKRDFLRYGTGAWSYDQYNVGHRIRFIILPGPSGVGGLVIVMNAPGADFEGAATALDALLATIQFDPAPSPTN